MEDDNIDKETFFGAFKYQTTSRIRRECDRLRTR